MNLDATMLPLLKILKVQVELCLLLSKKTMKQADLVMYLQKAKHKYIYGQQRVG